MFLTARFGGPSTPPMPSNGVGCPQQLQRQEGILFPRPFLAALEWRICDEFRYVDVPIGGTKYMWCDGLIPHSEARDNGCVRVSGTAWMMGLPWKNQKPGDQEWEFVLRLPPSVESAEDDDLRPLVPANDVHGWLEVDLNERLLTIALPDP